MRYFCVGLLRTCRELCNGTDESRAQTMLVEGIVKIEDISIVTGWHLSENQIAELKRQTRNVSSLLHFLQTEAVKKKRLLWATSFKNHLSWHLADAATFFASTMWSCYTFEDFVGRISAMAQASAPGCSLLSLSKKVIQQYLLYIAVLFRDARANS